MRYGIVAALLAGMVGCAWFGGDEDEDRRTGRADEVDRVDEREGTKVGFTRDEVFDDETGDTAIDPVSGEVVRQDTRFTMTWEGLTYYFDSEDNRESFEDNPEAYVTEDGYLKRPLDEVRREAQVR